MAPRSTSPADKDSATLTPPARSRRAPAAPTPLARRFVRYVVGFGVSVAVGLAPYLGRLRVPGFDALLNLIPDTLQSVALPLSAAVMGTLAVCVQWFGEEHLTRTWLRRAFVRTLATFISAFIVLMVVQSFVVTSVRVPAEGRTASFLVGFQRPYREPCPIGVSDAECIKRLTLDDARIAAFWGDGAIRAARLALLVPYLVTTGAFGTLVGLLLMRGEVRQRQARR
jgi:hypothetical protein